MPEVTPSDIMVCIIAYRRHHKLRRAVHSVLQQSHPPNSLLIIDNCPEQSAWTLVEQLKKESPFPLYYRTSPENNLGGARALAVALCQSSWIAFLDSDCEAPKSWVKAYTKILNKECVSDAVGFGAPSLPPNEKKSPLFYQAYLQMTATPLGHLNSPQAKASEKVWRPRHIPTSNSVFNCAAVLEVGNLDKNFRFVCEDVELSQRLLKQGYELKFYPGPQVRHHWDSGSRNWFSKMKNYGLGQFLVALKHPGHLTSLSIIAPVAFLAIIFASGITGWLEVLLGAYLMSLLVLSFWPFKNQVGVKGRCLTLPLFMITHAGYSLGWLLGALFYTKKMLFTLLPLSCLLFERRKTL